MQGDEELWKRARETAEHKVGFFVHLAVYLGVNGMLIAIWAWAGGITSFPWFLFPLGGWGIGLAAHFLAVFGGSGYVETQARQEYERLKRARSGPGPASRV